MGLVLSLFYKTHTEVSGESGSLLGPQRTQDRDGENLLPYFALIGKNMEHFSLQLCNVSLVKLS